MKKLAIIILAAAALTRVALTKLGYRAQEAATVPAASDSAAPAAAQGQSAAAAAPPTDAEKRALEIYGRYSVGREKYDDMYLHGSIKLTMTSDQAKRDYTETGMGVIPTSKEGWDDFTKQVVRVEEVGVMVQLAAKEAIAQAQREPPEVRAAFWSLMPLPGLKRPVLTEDGRHVFFLYTKHSDDFMFSESSAPVVDPADSSILAEIYDWDLGDGRLRLASDGQPLRRADWASPSADGSILAFLSQETGWGKPANIGVAAAKRASLEWLVEKGPLTPLPPAKPIPEDSRRVSQPSLSADGAKVLFSAGNVYGNQYDGFEEYHSLLLLDRATKTLKSLAGPVDKAPVAILSGDGGTAAVRAVAAAFGRKPSPQQRELLFLLPVAGGPGVEVPLSTGAIIDHGRSDERPPMAVSRDGSRLVFEAWIDQRSGVYLLDKGYELVRQVGLSGARDPVLSADGGRVAYVSDRQIYLYDVASGSTTLVSKNASGSPVRGDCLSPSISGDGSAVAFASNAADLGESLHAALKPYRKPSTAYRLWVYLVKEDRLVGFGSNR